ncbi:hypothetical protein [Carnobacterium inhibens]|uniref:Uncharacterized protein n=2 Tax=Carnobacterium inhibens TaxID=147709 RepID=U5SCJ0_9LACT|nr:hypothetical protein [Carnobacterium inhibens]AGY82960.1 hypothetical protein Q783_11640 [Carnobacterium inhibens subsp. gilichinskyi]MBC9826223.1 hypothetical protein [Carnobacterium inhibens]
MKKLLLTVTGTVTVLILIVSLFSLNQTNQALESKLSKKENELKTMEQLINQEDKFTDTVANQKKLTVIEEGLRTYLDYDNDTYLTRFEHLQNKATDETIQRLKELSSTDPPLLDVNNQVMELTIYLHPTEELIFLVQLTTEYSLDHEVVSHLPQLYQVTLIETNEEYHISQLTNLGLIATN